MMYPVLQLKSLVQHVQSMRYACSYNVFSLKNGIDFYYKEGTAIRYVDLISCLSCSKSAAGKLEYQLFTSES